MRPSVYIDTSIPSYYVDSRPSLEVHIQRTRQWWDDEREHYEVFTSEFVLSELEEGEFPNKQRAIELIESVPVLGSYTEIEEIAAIYVDNYVMPGADVRDALHLAFSSYYKLDYLLTWNCAHLANANKRAHIARINLRQGLHTPIIITPLELIFTEGSD